MVPAGAPPSAIRWGGGGLVVWTALLLGASAWAVPAPEDFRSVVHRSAAAELEALNASGHHLEVLQQGARFEAHVEGAALVRYEMAYAANRLGQERKALRLYTRALALQPDLAIALYDRGELRLLADDLSGARADFEAAARSRPDHWAVHYRLAHLAGREGKPEAMEEHLVEALRHGFDFRTLLGDSDWRAWSRDPSLGRVLQRLLVVYSDESVWDQLTEEEQ